jgi:hypothetical protein
VAHTIIPALGKLRQENPKFKASLGYMASPCHKKRSTEFIENSDVWQHISASSF